MNRIIDTGLVEFELPFDRGTEKIYFNPNDIDFYVRIVDMVESISALYEGAEEKFSNATENTDKLNVLRTLDMEIKDLFDVGFVNKVSDKIFKFVSPHGIVAGNQYYSFYILEYLLPIIEKTTEKTAKAATTALSKAINKHGSKYAHKLK